MKTAWLVALVLLVAPFGATAAEDIPLQQMVEQQTLLRDELARGPQDLTPRQVGAIRKAQDEFFRLVAGKDSMDQLAIHEKVRLENALERINAQLVGTNAASANQEVCWREKTVGTKLNNTRCGTRQEIDDAREGARLFLEKPKVCSGPGCGG